MMYVDFIVGNETYKLRLSVRNIVALEKQLGCNPLSIFGDGETLPTITTMVQILHASLQSLNHGIDMNTAYDLFEKWLNDGHEMAEFLAIIVEVYKVSGLIKNSGESEKN